MQGQNVRASSQALPDNPGEAFGLPRIPNRSPEGSACLQDRHWLAEPAVCLRIASLKNRTG